MTKKTGNERGKTMNTIERALYRAKTVEHQLWVSGNLVYGNGTWIFNGTDSYKVLEETVGQWSGLTDKNGVKIFEGDVIGHKHGSEKYVVIFDSGMFIGKHICKKGFLNPLDFELYEVLGTIHDNPELMEVKE